MSKLLNPISVRFPKAQESKIRSAAKKTGLSQQDTIRLAVERGLPHLLAALGMEKSKRTATA